MSGVISLLPHYVLETIAFGGILLIVLFSLGSEGSGEIVPLLALYAFAGYRLLPALQEIFATISSIRHNSPAMEVLYRDLNHVKVTAFHNLSPKASRNPQPLPLIREFVLRDVAYTYPGARLPAINGISLTIARNTCIGFVGGTGSGKKHRLRSHSWPAAPCLGPGADEWNGTQRRNNQVPAA